MKKRNDGPIEGGAELARMIGLCRSRVMATTLGLNPPSAVWEFAAPRGQGIAGYYERWIRAGLEPVSAAACDLSKRFLARALFAAKFPDGHFHVVYVSTVGGHFLQESFQKEEQGMRSEERRGWLRIGD
jgi:hypothetical protein